MSLLKRILAWWVANWHRGQRSADLRFLWPACKQLAPDLDRAKAAFAVHAYNDEAWLALGEDEVYRQIDALR
jgi:hypothetical protein